MTDIKYKILETLYNAPLHSMQWTTLLKLFPTNESVLALEVYGELKEDELIIEVSETAKLTKPGRRLYETVKNERHQREESERREHRAHKIAIISLVAALVSAIAAALSAAAALIELLI